MKRFLATDDLLWASYILFLALFFGLAYHWSLVQTAWRGELPAYLEKLRAERRAVEFKGVPTVDLKEAYELWKEGQTLFLDARKPEDFAELHIPKALNLPPEQLENVKNIGILGLPRERRILVYCAKKECDSAFKVARHLQSLGFTQVVAFIGGFQDWDEAGYEVDSRR